MKFLCHGWKKTIIYGVVFAYVRIPLIKTYWLPKAIYETNCFGMAVAVGGQTPHIGRSTEMGFGVFETTFVLQTMVMRPSSMISPSPNI